MKTYTPFKVVDPDFELIQAIKNQVDELYLRNQIFSLSLENLELTRRFNTQYNSLKALKKMKSADLSKFLALTQHLERNLIQELK